MFTALLAPLSPRFSSLLLGLTLRLGLGDFWGELVTLSVVSLQSLLLLLVLSPAAILWCSGVACLELSAAVSGGPTIP